jgi:ubiquinone/menaquinone biosynthesis C-methylase UbiE
MSAPEAFRFDGSIPEVYDRGLGPLIFEPYAVDLARRVLLPQRARVLELAAGTGRVTRHLRARLPAGGKVVATDLSEPMLERGRTLLGEGPDLEWRLADATALPFEDGRFDAVVCQFGLMFFPDKAAGAKEAFRVLTPGGRAHVNVWDTIEMNPLIRVADETVSKFFASDPPPFYKIPFSYPDPEALRALFANAGFVDVAVETVALTGESPSAAEAASGVVRGNPIINDLRERGTADVEEIERTVARVLAERFGDRPLRVPMRAHVLEARRPSSPRPREGA